MKSVRCARKTILQFDIISNRSHLIWASIESVEKERGKKRKNFQNSEYSDTFKKCEGDVLVSTSTILNA